MSLFNQSLMHLKAHNINQKPLAGRIDRGDLRK